MIRWELPYWPSSLSRVLQKLKVTQLVKKFCALYGTRRSTTTFPAVQSNSLIILVIAAANISETSANFCRLQDATSQKSHLLLALGPQMSRTLLNPWGCSLTTMTLAGLSPTQCMPEGGTVTSVAFLCIGAITHFFRCSGNSSLLQTQLISLWISERNLLSPASISHVAI